MSTKRSSLEETIYPPKKRALYEHKRQSELSKHRNVASERHAEENFMKNDFLALKMKLECTQSEMVCMRPRSDSLHSMHSLLSDPSESVASTSREPSPNEELFDSRTPERNPVGIFRREISKPLFPVGVERVSPVTLDVQKHLHLGNDGIAADSNELSGGLNTATSVKSLSHGIPCTSVNSSTQDYGRKYLSVPILSKFGVDDVQKMEMVADLQNNPNPSQQNVSYQSSEIGTNIGPMVSLLSRFNKEALEAQFDQEQKRKHLAKKNNPAANSDFSNRSVRKGDVTSTISMMKENMFLPGLKMYKCRICNKDFEEHDQLKTHMKADHSGPLPYKCDHCDRAFSQYNNLQRHLRVHRAKIYKCHLCDREFNEEFYLNMHMGTHTGKRVYSCGVCSAAFTSNQDLKLHVKTHSPSQLHTCDVCHKSFSKACVLRQHKKGHSGLRPHKCEKCPKTFIHRHHLTMHMKSHSDDKPDSETGTDGKNIPPVEGKSLSSQRSVCDENVPKKTRVDTDKVPLSEKQVKKLYNKAAEPKYPQKLPSLSEAFVLKRQNNLTPQHLQNNLTSQHPTSQHQSYIQSPATVMSTTHHTSSTANLYNPMMPTAHHHTPMMPDVHPHNPMIPTTHPHTPMMPAAHLVSSSSHPNTPTLPYHHPSFMSHHLHPNLAGSLIPNMLVSSGYHNWYPSYSGQLQAYYNSMYGMNYTTQRSDVEGQGSSVSESTKRLPNYVQNDERRRHFEDKSDDITAVGNSSPKRNKHEEEQREYKCTRTDIAAELVKMSKGSPKMDSVKDAVEGFGNQCYAEEANTTDYRNHNRIKSPCIETGHTSSSHNILQEEFLRPGISTKDRNAPVTNSKSQIFYHPSASNTSNELSKHSSHSSTVSRHHRTELTHSNLSTTSRAELKNSSTSGVQMNTSYSRLTKHSNHASTASRYSWPGLTETSPSDRHAKTSNIGAEMVHTLTHPDGLGSTPGVSSVASSIPSPGASSVSSSIPVPSPGASSVTSSIPVPSPGASSVASSIPVPSPGASSVASSIPVPSSGSLGHPYLMSAPYVCPPRDGMPYYNYPYLHHQQGYPVNPFLLNPAYWLQTDKSREGLNSKTQMSASPKKRHYSSQDVYVIKKPVCRESSRSTNRHRHLSESPKIFPSTGEPPKSSGREPSVEDFRVQKKVEHVVERGGESFVGECRGQYDAAVVVPKAVEKKAADVPSTTSVTDKRRADENVVSSTVVHVHSNLNVVSSTNMMMNPNQKYNTDLTSEATETQDNNTVDHRRGAHAKFYLNDSLEEKNLEIDLESSTGDTHDASQDNVEISASEIEIRHDDSQDNIEISASEIETRICSVVEGIVDGGGSLEITVGEVTSSVNIVPDNSVVTVNSTCHRTVDSDIAKYNVNNNDDPNYNVDRYYDSSSTVDKDAPNDMVNTDVLKDNANRFNCDFAKIENDDSVTKVNVNNLKVAASRNSESDKEDELVSEYGGSDNASMYKPYKDLVNSDFNTETRDLNTEIGDFNTETHDLNTEIGDLNTKIGDFNTEMRDLNTEISDFNTETRDFNTETRDLNTETRDLNTKISDFNTETSNIPDVCDRTGALNLSLREQQQEVTTTTQADTLKQFPNESPSFNDKELCENSETGPMDLSVGRPKEAPSQGLETTTLRVKNYTPIANSDDLNNVCGICWERFESSTAFEEHQIEHAKKLDTKSRCGICDKVFLRPFDLQCHIIKHRQSVNNVNNSSQNILKPRQSVSNANNSSQNILKPRQSVNNVNNNSQNNHWVGNDLTAMKVGYGHGNQSGFIQNDREVNQSVGGIQTEAQSSRNPARNNGIMKHGDTCLYKCEICLREFSHKHNLNRHKMSHNDKSFACATCKRTFKEKFYLQMHMKSHTEEKTRECEICGMQVPKSEIWKHTSLHLGTITGNPTYEQIGCRVNEILKLKSVEDNLVSNSVNEILKQKSVEDNLVSNSVNEILKRKRVDDNLVSNNVREIRKQKHVQNNLVSDTVKRQVLGERKQNVFRDSPGSKVNLHRPEDGENRLPFPYSHEQPNVQPTSNVPLAAGGVFKLKNSDVENHGINRLKSMPFVSLYG